MRSRLNAILLVTLLFLSSFLVLTKVSEQSMSNSLLYPLKRLSEEITFRLISSHALKAKYFSELIEKRFEELVYIVENDKTGFLEETAGRYVSFLGEYVSKYQETNYLKPNKDRYLFTLSKLRDKYPANTPYWLILQQAVDVTRNL